MINIQSTLRTPPDLCQNVSLQCYLVETVIYIQILNYNIYIYIHTHTYPSQYREAGRAIGTKKKKKKEISEFRVPYKARVP